MDQLRILLSGRSIALLDEIKQELSAVLPTFDLQVMAGHWDLFSDSDRSDVAAYVLCLQGREEESWGSSLLQSLQETNPRIPIFVIAQEDDAALGLRLLELGASDWTCGPAGLPRLAALLEVPSLCRLWTPAPPCPYPAIAEPPQRAVAGFVFAGRTLGELYDHLQTTANSDSTIFLTGESGTGKTHAARAIHALSPRRDKPFVAVGCAGLSATLLQSELFGHVPGAFAGADAHYAGRLAAAAGGTILLDEIDCLPPDVQLRLLSVLDRGVYEPLGSADTSECQARVLVAANRSLDPLVADGQFRADLFSCLRKRQVRLPPLRDCRDAILPLAESLLGTCCARMGRRILGFTAAAQAALRVYRWPGNVRELGNVVRWAVILCRRDWLGLDDLSEEIRRATTITAGFPSKATRSAEPWHRGPSPTR